MLSCSSIKCTDPDPDHQELDGMLAQLILELVVQVSQSQHISALHMMLVAPELFHQHLENT
jgi:hypothetical protein